MERAEPTAAGLAVERDSNPCTVVILKLISNYMSKVKIGCYKQIWSRENPVFSMCCPSTTAQELRSLVSSERGCPNKVLEVAQMIKERMDV